MIDAHCHLDDYPDPLRMAGEIERSKILTIAVTGLPSAFEEALTHLRGFRYIRAALGLHPLLAGRHSAERDLFASCLSRTSYVGEVGLDFSEEGKATALQQVESFRFVLEAVRKKPRFLSVHSRRAEEEVIDLLEEAHVGPAVFHWYSGSEKQLQRLLRLGHMCSVNPAMTRNARGRALVEQMPPERVLTETDGPYVRVGARQSEPRDVVLVERFLADRWGKSVADVRRQVLANLRAAIPGAISGPHPAES